MGLKVHFLFSKICHLAYEFNWNEARTPCKQIFCPLTHPLSLDGGQRSKHFFSEEGYAACYQI